MNLFIKKSTQSNIVYIPIKIKIKIKTSLYKYNIIHAYI